MKNILYIGNNLSSKTTNISGIQRLGNFLQNEGYQLRYASSKENKILRFIDMLWSCVKWSRDVDWVLIDTYSTQNFYYAYVVSWVCRFLRLKYIPILHGGNLPERLKNNPKLCRSIFNYSKYNVSPSIYMCSIFQEQGFTNTIFIPNAIEINDYPLVNKHYNTPKILWVRSFSKIYNPELAVLVLKQLRKSYPDAQLCMVGPDADGTLVQVKALCNELGLEVEFSGKLDKTDWIELSKDYNVFINTSNFDNMPVSVLEAMALGFPIVSTNVGGIPFLIEHETHGLLVPPDDPEEMSKSVTTIFQDPEMRHHLITNARQWSETFDWTQVKTKWDDIFRE